MAPTSSLEILITGRDEASKVLREISGEAGGLHSKLTALAGAVAGLAAGFLSFRALEDAINTTAELGSEIRKLSRETGLAAEEASRLRFAGHELGIGADELSTSLGRLSKNLLSSREEALGFTKTENTFQKLMDSMGIATLDASKQMRPLNDVLMDIADRFQTIPNAAEKAGIAQQIFGKSGKDMLPILNLGAEGIRELGLEADKLGLTFDQVALDKTRQYVESQRKLSAALDGVKVTIGMAVIPALTDLANWFTEHQADVRKFVEDAISKIEDFGESFVRGLKRIDDGLSWIPDHQGTIIAAIAAIGVAMAVAFGPESLALAGLVAIVGLIGQIGQHEGHFFSDLETKVKNETYFYGGQNVPATMGQGQSPPLIFGPPDIQESMVKLDDGFKAVGAAAGKAKTLLESLSEVFSKSIGTTRERADLEVQLAKLELQKVEREKAADDRAKALAAANDAAEARNKAAGIMDMYAWNKAHGLPAPGSNQGSYSVYQTGGTLDASSAIDKQIESIKHAIEIEDKRTALLKAQFDAANQGLLTDKQRDLVARGLTQAEYDATAPLSSFGSKIAALFPDLDKLPGAISAAIAAAAKADALMQHPDVPHYGSGGYVGKPTLAIVGDAPGGEYIVPADQMLGINQGATGVAAQVSGTISALASLGGIGAGTSSPGSGGGAKEGHSAPVSGGHDFDLGWLSVYNPTRYMQVLQQQIDSGTWSPLNGGPSYPMTQMQSAYGYGAGYAANSPYEIMKASGGNLTGQNPTIVINVAGSVLSERDLLQVVRDGIAGGGLRGVVAAA